MVFWACFYFSHCFYCWNIVTWNEILGRVALFFPPWVSLNHRISVLSFKILGTQITRILFCVWISPLLKKTFCTFFNLSFFSRTIIYSTSYSPCVFVFCVSFISQRSEWMLLRCLLLDSYWKKKLCQSKSWLACWNTSISEVYLGFISTGWQD